MSLAGELASIGKAVLPLNWAAKYLSLCWKSAPRGMVRSGCSRRSVYPGMESWSSMLAFIHRKPRAWEVSETYRL